MTSSADFMSPSAMWKSIRTRMRARYKKVIAEQLLQEQNEYTKITPGLFSGDATMHSGACSCGDIQFRLLAEPMFVHCCHCLDCQKQSGGAFAINALIEASNVETVKGEPHAVTMPTESGRPHIIYRCPKCEVALWSIYGGRQQVRFVRVSTLDKPHAIVPDVHIFTRSKVPWVGLPAGARAFEVYYDMAKEWPAESLARRKAAMAQS